MCVRLNIFVNRLAGDFPFTLNTTGFAPGAYAVAFTAEAGGAQASAIFVVTVCKLFH